MKYHNSNGNRILKECTDIDIMSSSFKQKYLEIISRNIPSKMIQVRPSDKPWFNSDIKGEIRTPDRLKKMQELKNRRPLYINTNIIVTW
jgi:hypothetical protein